MADLERAARIKALREQRHLTQPAVADEVGVTLRAYQAWEATGALKWDNATKLAEFFGVDRHVLWTGNEHPADTPALLQAMDGGKDDLTERLDRIEQGQDAIAQKLDYLFELMDTAADEAAAAETQANGRRSARTPGRRTPGAEPPAR